MVMEVLYGIDTAKILWLSKNDIIQYEKIKTKYKCFNKHKHNIK